MNYFPINGITRRLSKAYLLVTWYRYTIAYIIDERHGAEHMRKDPPRQSVLSCEMHYTLDRRPFMPRIDLEIHLATDI